LAVNYIKYVKMYICGKRTAFCGTEK